MDKLKEIKKSRRKAHTTLVKNSKVYRSFLDMEQVTYSDGALKRKEKELIAVGISVVINCESCMQWHIEMGGGPATAHARFALEVLESLDRDA